MMKNVKLVVLVTMTLLFFGMGSVNAQEKSSVLITVYYYNSGKTEIEIVKPDYEVERKMLNGKVDNFLVSIKKEVDNWLNQGYKLVESSSNSLGSMGERMIFVLIKEE